MKRYLGTELFTSKGMVGLSTIPPKGARNEKGFMEYKAGAVLLYGANSTAPHKYDFKNKVSMSMNALEVAQILNVGNPALPPMSTWSKQKPGAKVEEKKEEKIAFFHDTGKGGPDEGKNIKSLTIQQLDSMALPGTKSYGFFFLQKNNGVETKVQVYLNFIQFLNLQEDLRIAYQSVKVVEEPDTK